MDEARVEITVWTSAETGPRLTAAELAHAAGIEAPVLELLVRRGFVEPAEPGGDTFALAALVRLRRMLRLRAELEVSLHAAALIVDLLERVDRMDAELRRLRGAESE
jgi:chaperone modulatory protein CbpM